jgi:AAA domain
VAYPPDFQEWPQDRCDASFAEEARDYRKRGNGPANNKRAPEGQAEIILPRVTAKVWQWRDPCTIPPRQWLHGGHYIRKFASATIAPGGLGKSTLSLVDFIGMACGRNLLGGICASRPLTVWYWNLEDPQEEIDRRISAILIYYGIDYEEIRGRLLVNSEEPLIIAAKTTDQTLIYEPVLEALKYEISSLDIDAVGIDPFVSCHRVPENDNPAIDAVAKTWAAIARETDCAIDLVHHVRKPSGAQSEFSVNDARGGSSLIAATRSNRVLNRMTREEAERAGIPIEERRFYFRVDKGEKDNMRPPIEKAEWRKLVSVCLDNATDEAPADNVGVVTKWQMPSAFDGVTARDLLRVQQRISEGEWREDHRSKQWAGIAVAEVLDLDHSEKSARGKLKILMHTWVKNGALKVVSRKDEQRKNRNFIEVGAWANT